MELGKIAVVDKHEQIDKFLQYAELFRDRYATIIEVEDEQGDDRLYLFFFDIYEQGTGSQTQ